MYILYKYYKGNVNICQQIAQDFVRYLAEINKKYIFDFKKRPKMYIDYIYSMYKIKRRVL